MYIVKVEEIQNGDQLQIEAVPGHWTNLGPIRAWAQARRELGKADGLIFGQPYRVVRLTPQEV